MKSADPHRAPYLVPTSSIAIDPEQSQSYPDLGTRRVRLPSLVPLRGRHSTEEAWLDNFSLEIFLAAYRQEQVERGEQ
ncbi:unnamed protein product [Lampetra planeri]